MESRQRPKSSVFLDEIGDVVISNKEQVEWHVLAVAEKLVFGSGEFQSAADEQVGGEIRKSPGFLNGKLEAGRFVHDVLLSVP
jgi:hypothetical protein